MAWLVLTAAFVWFYWSSINKLGRVWWTQEDYQHGFVVPIFAVVLLWLRREMIVPFAGRGSWWGLAFFALWALMRWAAVYFNFESLPEMSMVPFFAGVALFVGGWQGFRWAWPAVLFLVFMIPLPGAVQGMARLQMQTLATKLSVFVIQTLGIPAVPEGVVIQLDGQAPAGGGGVQRIADDVAVLRGLRRGGVHHPQAFVGKALHHRQRRADRHCLQRNQNRVDGGALRDRPAMAFGDRTSPATAEAEKLVHDTAGLLMPIVGLLLLWVEMALLSKLLIAPLPERPLVVGRLAAEGTIGTGGRRMARSKE